MADDLLQVDVELPRQSYSIHIGTAILDHMVAISASQAGTQHAVLVTDSNVKSLHADSVAASLLHPDVRGGRRIVSDQDGGQRGRDVRLFLDPLYTGCRAVDDITGHGAAVQ